LQTELGACLVDDFDFWEEIIRQSSTFFLKSDVEACMLVPSSEIWQRRFCKYLNPLKISGEETLRTDSQIIESLVNSSHFLIFTGSDFSCPISPSVPSSTVAGQEFNAVTAIVDLSILLLSWNISGAQDGMSISRYTRCQE
jgi:hypothetical protein